jgi:large subunit ribosomal protein L23
VANASKKRYAFEVLPGATKPAVKKAVEELFKVKVLKIQTMIVSGKKYRAGKRAVKKLRPDWKKAVVTIKPDQKIDLFEAAGGEGK